MPLDNVKYRVKPTAKGPVRLAFKGKGKGKVVEAKNLKSGAMHTEGEFAHDEHMQRKHRMEAFEKDHGEKAF